MIVNKSAIACSVMRYNNNFTHKGNIPLKFQLVTFKRGFLNWIFGIIQGNCFLWVFTLELILNKWNLFTNYLWVFQNTVLQLHPYTQNHQFVCCFEQTHWMMIWVLVIYILNMIYTIDLPDCHAWRSAHRSRAIPLRIPHTTNALQSWPCGIINHIFNTFSATVLYWHEHKALCITI